MEKMENYNIELEKLKKSFFKEYVANSYYIDYDKVRHNIDKEFERFKELEENCYEGMVDDAYGGEDSTRYIGDDRLLLCYFMEHQCKVYKRYYNALDKIGHFDDISNKILWMYKVKNFHNNNITGDYITIGPFRTKEMIKRKQDGYLNENGIVKTLNPNSKWELLKNIKFEDFLDK